ncbi:hypothetical protein [Streptomyces sp. NPDC056632]|uniref:hypothetical protein n=1 Tax=Streptomyces sp. NPDC056632 TaxID=3345884 RepID=UPI0036826F5F
MIPREVSYLVRRNLIIPEDGFRDGVIILYAVAAPEGDAWTISVRLRPDDVLLGQARTAARNVDEASSAAEKWVKDHAAKSGLSVVSSERLHEQMPQPVWSAVSLTRFTLSREGPANVTGWLTDPASTAASE